MALKVFGLAVVRDAITVADFLTQIIAGDVPTGNTVNSFGGVVAVTGGAYACDESDYSVDFARDDIEASGGALATVLVKRQIEKLKITILPFASTEALSPDMLVQPAPMVVITLSGSTNAAYNGTWNYCTGGTVKCKKAGAAVMTWNLERYDGAALAFVSDS